MATSEELQAAIGYARSRSNQVVEMLEMGPGLLVTKLRSGDRTEILFDLSRWQIKPSVLVERPDLEPFGTMLVAGKFASIEKEDVSSDRDLWMSTLDQGLQYARQLLDPFDGISFHNTPIAIDCGGLGA